MIDIVFDTAFNKYKIIDIIGEGGSGRVYKVEDESNCQWAIKLLIPERITEEKNKRFKNEINFCIKSNHKNILTIEDYGFIISKNKKCPFYVMKIYPSTFKTIITKEKNQKNKLILFSKILDGIEAAHLQQVFHRDLKPENILCNLDNNEIKIADFGIAHFNENLIKTNVETKSTSKLANFCYAAPEQRIKGSLVDYKCDIFSLGLILNELFTNDIPHGVGYKKIVDVDESYGYLDSIVHKMIQQNPDDRYNSIEDIKKDLIAQENLFITRQKLFLKNNEVIEIDKNIEFEKTKCIDVDFIDNHLIFKINKLPETKWIEIFKSPKLTFEYIIGYHPNFFRFYRNTLSIELKDENDAKRIVDFFNKHIAITDRTYISFKKNEILKNEEILRSKLKEEVESLEKKERILKSINL